MNRAWFPPSLALIVLCSAALPAAAEQGRLTRHLRRGPQLTVGAEAGYLYYSYAVPIAGDSASFHGPAYNASLSLTWPLARRFRAGLRLHGVLGQGREGELVSGDLNFGGGTPHGPVKSPATALLGGGYVSGLVLSDYWWLALGAGVLHLSASSVTGASTPLEESFTLPELILGGGLRLPLGQRVSLRLGGEVGTLLTTWRLCATGGVAVSF